MFILSPCLPFTFLPRVHRLLCDHQGHHQVRSLYLTGFQPPMFSVEQKYTSQSGKKLDAYRSSDSSGTPTDACLKKECSLPAGANGAFLN